MTTGSPCGGVLVVALGLTSGAVFEFGLRRQVCVDDVQQLAWRPVVCLAVVNSTLAGALSCVNFAIEPSAATARGVALTILAIAGGTPAMAALLGIRSAVLITGGLEPRQDARRLQGYLDLRGMAVGLLRALRASRDRDRVRSHRRDAGGFDLRGAQSGLAQRGPSTGPRADSSCGQGCRGVAEGTRRTGTWNASWASPSACSVTSSPESSCSARSSRHQLRCSCPPPDSRRRRHMRHRRPDQLPSRAGAGRPCVRARQRRPGSHGACLIRNVNSSVEPIWADWRSAASGCRLEPMERSVVNRE